MKKLVFMLTLLVATGVSAQSIPDSAKTVWQWPNEVIQAALDEGVIEYNLASKKVINHEIESSILAITILCGYLFLCFVVTASNKTERMTIFNRIPIIINNAAIVVASVMFISSEALIISKVVIGIFAALSLLTVILAIFYRYWGAKATFTSALAMILPANIALGVITSSWLAFLGSFAVLLVISVSYFSIWGLITRILKGKAMEEGGSDDDE